MSEGKDIRKIERRAKSLLLSKDIPPEKMEIVRTLLNNKALNDEERYRAIVELIHTCPDKPVKGPLLTSIELLQKKKEKQHDSTVESVSITPTFSSIHINEIYDKYKKYGIFKKRYLIRSGNKLGFWFKKRLIPTKKLLKILSELNSFKDHITSIVHDVLEHMLQDDSFNEIQAFNFLAAIRTHIPHITLARYSFDTIKWMEREDFEREVKEFTIGFLSYYLLPTETKEYIIHTFEKAITTMDGYRKAVINERDTERIKITKEKQNLESEKKKYAAILAIRTFFISQQNSECALAYHLEQKYRIPSLPWLIVSLHEALILQRNTTLEEIISYYKAKPISVKDSSYQYDIAELKKYGKDDESLRMKKIESLKEELQSFEEKYLFLKMEYGGENLLLRCFDEQWRLIDKRRGDSSEVYKVDFLIFLDGVVNYFKNFYLKILSGDIIFFESDSKETIEGRIFDSSYFEREIRDFDEIAKEFYFFRSNNPNMAITYDELQKILKGQIKSMNSVGVLLKKIGGIFYRFAKGLHEVITGHKKWLHYSHKAIEMSILRVPLDNNARELELKDGLRAIPYNDCRFKALHDITPLSKSYAGYPIINKDLNEGLLILITAFCYQIAYECGSDEIIADLEERKKILKTLRELAENT
ncbi:MAG: hypothetical protein N2316_07090 [Spirochaetes bacterium]|nr:hypothetical protein [Spirochaetota bacterium]